MGNHKMTIQRNWQQGEEKETKTEHTSLYVLCPIMHK